MRLGLGFTKFLVVTEEEEACAARRDALLRARVRVRVRVRARVRVRVRVKACRPAAAGPRW